MLAWLKYGNGETPESSGKKGDHLIGDYYVAFDKHYKAEVKSSWLNIRLKVWTKKKQRQKLKQTLRWCWKHAKCFANGKLTTRKYVPLEEKDEWLGICRFRWNLQNDGVSFDKIYYESGTYLEGKEPVMEGLEKDCSITQGRRFCMGRPDSGRLDHKLLLRGDGTSVYMTQDIGTAKLASRIILSTRWFMW